MPGQFVASYIRTVVPPTGRPRVMFDAVCTLLDGTCIKLVVAMSPEEERRVGAIMDDAVDRVMRLYASPSLAVRSAPRLVIDGEPVTVDEP